MSQSAEKWVPVVGDACTGCGLCVHACENHCFELVWDFATLQHPHHCISDGKCAEVCPRSVIQMQWVKADGDSAVGVWREELSRPAVPSAPARHWVFSLLGRRNQSTS